MHKYCKVTVKLNAILPVARYLTNGHWVVSTQTKLPFVKMCERGHETVTSDLIVRPPIQLIALEESCTAVTGEMTLPPHYHKESKFDVTNVLETFMDSYNVSSVKLWEPIHSKITNLSAIKIPTKLKDLETIPMDRLVNELTSITPIDPSFGFNDWPNWVYAILGMATALLIGIAIFSYRYCKRRWSGKLWQRNKKPNTEGEHIPLVTIKTSGEDNASRDTKASAPMVPITYNKEMGAADTIKQLYPSIRLDNAAEQTK